MLVANISDFRKDLKKYLDLVSDNFETLIINKSKNKGIVVMSLEEYNALNATHHELSSAKNKARLDAAIQKIKGGKYIEKKLVD